MVLECAKILSIQHEGMLRNTSRAVWFHVETIIQYSLEVPRWFGEDLDQKLSSELMSGHLQLTTSSVMWILSFFPFVTA